MNEAFLLRPYLGPGYVYLPADAVVVDIGANIGDFTLQVAQQCPAGRVIAVEPVGEHLRMLREHVSLNGLNNVTCVQSAVGGKDGSTRLDLAGPQSRANGTTGPSDTEPVRLVTLSTLLRELRLTHVDLLKLDCEGAEWDILPEAGEALDRVSQICLEFHCERGWTPQRLSCLLRQRGYTVRHTSGAWNGLLWAVRRADERRGGYAA